MCGIIGAQGATEIQIRKALETFSYRGPDAQGFLAGECAMGHLRLSIIDLDPRSNQPMLDATNNYAIVFNGEIYNYKEIRSELERRRGVSFRTSSDTEVLLEGYKTWGKALLPKLRGMFAFAIYDQASRAVFLARDHAGIKPLYYSYNGGLVFASELKGVVSLMHSRGTRPAIDQSSLSLYKAFGYIPTPHTLVQGVQKLERGTWLLYDLASNASEYGAWHPETSVVFGVDELENVVRESILEHTVADVPVGLFFSGGIDSSVLAMVLQEAGMQLETFSLAVDGRDADAPYFNAIAKELGVKAHVARFGSQETAAMYDFVFSRMDDPIADSSILPTSYVAQMAKKHVTVVLSGEGGDELFQGYPRQETIAAMNGSSREKNILDVLMQNSPSFIGKRRLLLVLAKIAHDPAFFYLLTTSLAQDLLDKDSWARARSMLSQTNSLWFDRDWYLENMLLRKGDMATMYSSLEGRVPLLGAQVWNAAPQFVRENLEHGTKTVLREMLKRRLPAELIDRPKSGFGISTRQFFTDYAQARDDLSAALRAFEDYGFPPLQKQEMLMERYPAYAFGIIALYRSLKNLELV